VLVQEYVSTKIIIYYMQLHAQEQYNFSFYYTKKSKYTYKIQIGVS